MKAKDIKQGAVLYFDAATKWRETTFATGQQATVLDPVAKSWRWDGVSRTFVIDPLGRRSSFGILVELRAPGASPDEAPTRQAVVPLNHLRGQWAALWPEVSAAKQKRQDLINAYHKERDDAYTASVEAELALRALGLNPRITTERMATVSLKPHEAAQVAAALAAIGWRLPA